MKLLVNTSPHIKSRDTTRRIMLDVVIALIPALAAGVWQFGLRALLVALAGVSASLLAELICDVLMKKRITIDDGSAAVTGLLLSMTLPASVPYWTVALGGAFGVVIGKLACGGVGQNPFNPALAARAFLMLLFPMQLVRYAAPGTPLPLLGSVDVVASATPLHDMQRPALPGESLLSCFIGDMGGSIGEVSKLALLLGGAYLVFRRVIDFRIPLAYLGTLALLSLVFSSVSPVEWMLYNLLTGGAVLAAIFMATDYASSPVTPKGRLIYGAGCGALTLFFRRFGLFPEGATYAILLMNACAWAIDRLTAPRVYGKEGGLA
ncbi:MAG: RnfABCDGE type electron transport complex subunit D [Clostridia bacterium]|nr:RnfABCDGE type electron transport complex subunit D [Clostridia bacterium]